MKGKATFIIARNAQGAILLLRRPSDHPNHPNQWSLPGGKVDKYGEGRCKGPSHPMGGGPAIPWYAGGYGESTVEAAAAEFEEETGIAACALTELDIVMFSSKHQIASFIEHAIIGEPTREFPNREHSEYMFLELGEPYPEGISDVVKRLLNYILTGSTEDIATLEKIWGDAFTNAESLDDES